MSYHRQSPSAMGISFLTSPMPSTPTSPCDANPYDPVCQEIHGAPPVPSTANLPYPGSAVQPKIGDGDAAILAAARAKSAARSGTAASVSSIFKKLPVTPIVLAAGGALALYFIFGRKKASP